MNLVSVETPTARMATARETVKLLNAPLGIVSAGNVLQVVADQLIETLAESLRLLSSASDKLLIN